MLQLCFQLNICVCFLYTRNTHTHTHTVLVFQAWKATSKAAGATTLELCWDVLLLTLPDVKLLQSEIKCLPLHLMPTEKGIYPLLSVFALMTLQSSLDFCSQYLIFHIFL